MAKMLTVPSHLEITIRRPSGGIETITHPKFRTISDKDFRDIKAATLAAGRGECLSYVNVTKQVEEPAEFGKLTADERAYDASTAAIYRAMDARE
jgi:hypothetical protein